LICFPFGAPYAGATDLIRKRSAQLISTPSEIRDLLSEGIFISKNPSDRIRMLNEILPHAVAVDEMVFKAKKEQRQLTAAEEEAILKVQEVVNQIVQVDVFDKLGVELTAGDDYVRPALHNTKFTQVIVADKAA